MQVSAAEARALLDWYVAMGVDCAVGEQAIDRLDQPQIEAEGRHRTAGVGQPRAQHQLTEKPVALPQHAMPVGNPAATGAAAAQALAASVKTLDELREAMAGFEGCDLKKTATQLVFCDGVAGSPLMLVGEAPGRDEDREGKPFVGRSGQLLDRILRAIGRDRTNTYIANVVPWRPPANRTPSPEELALCLPFITRQIELANPRIVVLLGGVALSAITGAKQGIVKQRGQWQIITYGSKKIETLASFHPAYLLRNPLAKRLVWNDFLSVRARIHYL